MAPSLISSQSAVQSPLLRRADPPPACFAQCMGTTNLDGCSPTDLECLCASAVYVSAFSLCLGTTCPVVNRTPAYLYSQSLCEPFASGNGTTESDPTAPRATNNALDLRPNVRRITSGPITPVMTAICCFLLGISLINGIISIRNKHKREQEMTRDREWTTAGSVSKDYGMRTKHSSKYQTSSFGSNNYGQNSSNFGLNSSHFGDQSVNLAMSPIKESHRKEGDHWVLGEQDEDDKSPGPITPGASSGFEVETLDYTPDGSRVDLNPAEVEEDGKEKVKGDARGL